MPIYEYRCKACGAEMDIRQKFADDPLTDCPECGASELERLVSTSSFALKGSGWYADGYTGAKSEPKAAEGSKDTKDTGSKDSGSKDTSSSETKKKETKASDSSLKKAS